MRRSEANRNTAFMRQAGALKETSRAPSEILASKMSLQQKRF